MKVQVSNGENYNTMPYTYDNYTFYSIRLDNLNYYRQVGMGIKGASSSGSYNGSVEGLYTVYTMDNDGYSGNTIIDEEGRNNATNSGALIWIVTGKLEAPLIPIPTCLK